MYNEKSLQGIEAEEKVVQCPECGSKDIVKEDDENFCKKCGLVID